jgi:glyoxylase-like metal-dependent hydrolase (beta-lactamase superfamily II)
VEYLVTLGRLSEHPLLVFPGHGEPIERPAELIADVRAHHVRRVETVAGVLDGDGKSAWQLAFELFPL